MDRFREKEELTYKLGLLLSQVQALVEQPEHSEEERARVMAQFTEERTDLIQQFKSFSRGEPGFNYQEQYHSFHKALYRLPSDINRSPDKFAELVDAAVQDARTAIRSVPVQADSRIFISRTPFTTYCVLKGIASSATRSIVFVDRYLHVSVFFRYLSDLQPDVTITLVGPKRSMTDEFLDLSRVFAREMGSARYTLISVPYDDIHDRWFRADDTLLHFGNSNANAAMMNNFTISRIDNTPENNAVIDGVIASGTEQFSPNQTNHPQTKADLL